MMLPSLLALSLSVAASRPVPPCVQVESLPQGRDVRVRLDSAHREVVVTIGPFRVARSMPMRDDDPMMMAMMVDSVVGLFAWPLDAYIHGLRLEVIDAAGVPLPRRLLHHLNVMNFDRRQLLYPIVERLAGFGQETEDMSVPASIGLPLARGHRIGVVVMWDNETAQDLDGVSVRLTFRLNPRRQYPPPIAVLPLNADTRFVPGGANTFDVPPGGHSQVFEFTMPISGRLLAAGGHLHDHGAWIRLQDAATGRVLVTLRPLTDAAGRVTGMSRALLAVWGDGLHLIAGRRYRLLARYENPTPDTLRGMMGLLGGIFAPDEPRRWPALDRSNGDYLTDIRNLPGLTDFADAPRAAK
jgi:hypothetical protein